MATEASTFLYYLTRTADTLNSSINPHCKIHTQYISPTKCTRANCRSYASAEGESCPSTPPLKMAPTTCRASMQPSMCTVNSSHLRNLESPLRTLRTPQPHAEHFSADPHPLPLSPHPSSLPDPPIDNHSFYLFLVDIYICIIACYFPR